MLTLYYTYSEYLSNARIKEQYIYTYTYNILLYFVLVRSKRKCTFISILYTSEVRVCCIYPSFRKYSTLAKYSKVTVSVDY